MRDNRKWLIAIGLGILLGVLMPPGAGWTQTMEYDEEEGDGQHGTLKMLISGW